MSDGAAAAATAMNRHAHRFVRAQDFFSSDWKPHWESYRGLERIGGFRMTRLLGTALRLPRAKELGYSYELWTYSLLQNTCGSTMS